MMKIVLNNVTMFGDGLPPIIEVNDVFKGSYVNNNADATTDNGLQVCENILQSAKLQILWSDFGSESNPQPGVIKARVVYDTDDFIAQCDRPVDCLNLDTGTFGFRVETSVEYYKVKGSSVQMFVPPPPRLIPPLPNDIFYPFSLTNLV